MNPGAHQRRVVAPRGALSGVLVLLAALLVARAAEARPVVVVAPFRAIDHARLEQTVQRALKPRALVLSPARYALVAKGMFAEGTSPEDISAVARSMGARWAVTGTVKIDGSHWVLGVSLRDGATGRSRAKLHYSLPSPRCPPAILRRLQLEIVEELRNALLDPAPESDPGDARPPTRRAQRNTDTLSNPDDDDELPPSKVGDSSRRTRQPERTRPERARPEVTPEPTPEVTPEARPEETAVEQPPPKPKPKPQQPTGRPRWAPYFTVALGPLISSRNFALDPASIRFNKGVGFGIRFDATLYPLAFTWKNAYGLFSGVGLGISVDAPFWPPSTSKTDTTQTFPTTELRVEGGLRWKITLYKPMPRPQLHLIVEGGVHDFTFAKDAMGNDVVGVPDVHYTYASLGGGLTVHFADWSWIWLKFVYHAVTNAGPIQTPAQYGLAASNGFRFSGGLDFLVYKGVRIGVQGFYERFSIRFGFDPTNTAKVADGATDEYFGGMLMLGYVL